MCVQNFVVYCLPTVSFKQILETICFSRVMLIYNEMKSVVSSFTVAFINYSHISLRVISDPSGEAIRRYSNCESYQNCQ